MLTVISQLENGSLPDLLYRQSPADMSGFTTFLATRGSSARYRATFLVATSAFLLGPVSNSLLSKDWRSETARSAAVVSDVLLGSIGGSVSTCSYVPFEGLNPHRR